MSDPSKYHLRITAGPSYDPSTHQPVYVNTNTPINISSSKITSSVFVRIQNYRGLPPSSPHTSPYFSHPSHKNDLYSISFSFRLSEDINGADLLFGNDFDKPIRDRLPPGFGTAFRIVRWAIDPGLNGDVYAEEPYLYGPLLSSINVLRIGEEGGKEDKVGTSGAEDGVFGEGADGESAEELREEAKIPGDGAGRMKFFLDEKHRKAWTFEKGREYSCDFFNPYLDFNDLALRLPGITLHLMRFWDGQPLRYVLKHKNKEVDEPLIVIVIALISEEDLAKEEEKMKTNKSNESTGAGESKADDDTEKKPKQQDSDGKADFQDDDVD